MFNLKLRENSEKFNQTKPPHSKQINVENAHKNHTKGFEENDTMATTRGKNDPLTRTCFKLESREGFRGAGAVIVIVNAKVNVISIGGTIRRSGHVRHVLDEGNCHF